MGETNWWLFGLFRLAEPKTSEVLEDDVVIIIRGVAGVFVAGALDALHLLDGLGLLTFSRACHNSVQLVRYQDHEMIFSRMNLVYISTARHAIKMKRLR